MAATVDMVGVLIECPGCQNDMNVPPQPASGASQPKPPPTIQQFDEDALSSTMKLDFSDEATHDAPAPVAPVAPAPVRPAPAPAAPVAVAPVPAAPIAPVAQPQYVQPAPAAPMVQPQVAPVAQPQYVQPAPAPAPNLNMAPPVQPVAAPAPIPEAANASTCGGCQNPLVVDAVGTCVFCGLNAQTGRKISGT